MGERDLMRRLEALEQHVAELASSLENKTERFPFAGGSGGGFSFGFGKLKDEWVAGENNVTLTPCEEDGTAIDGAEDVTVTIHPGVGHVASFGPRKDMVLAYFSEGEQHYLFNHPQLPRSTTKYHVVQNTAPDGEPAAWRAQFVRGG